MFCLTLPPPDNKHLLNTSRFPQKHPEWELLWWVLEIAGNEGVFGAVRGAWGEDGCLGQGRWSGAFSSGLRARKELSLTGTEVLFYYSKGRILPVLPGPSGGGGAAAGLPLEVAGGGGGGQRWGCGGGAAALPRLAAGVVVMLMIKIKTTKPLLLLLLLLLLV